MHLGVTNRFYFDNFIMRSVTADVAPLCYTKLEINNMHLDPLVPFHWMSLNAASVPRYYLVSTPEQLLQNENHLSSAGAAGGQYAHRLQLKYTVCY